MSEYKKYYRITGGDEVKKFDGQELRRSVAADGSYRYTITQTQYIERVYKKYVTTSSDRARVSPIDVGADGAKKFMAITEAKTDAEKQDQEMASKDFLGLLGCVSYITLKTRPDCQFHVSRLGQCSINPSPAAYNALIVVLSYMYRAINLSVWVM